MPNFLKGKGQFTEEESKHNEKIASLRIHVERCMFNIPPTQLEFFLANGFTGTAIAAMLGVSLRTAVHFLRFFQWWGKCAKGPHCPLALP